jgi:hypothetical protein
MARQSLREFRNGFRSAESIFTEIYEKKYWGNKESVSGSGSTLDQTKNIIGILPTIFQKHDIKSVLDLPCGDFNWMKEVNLSEVIYHGADIVSDIVSENTKRYTQSNLSFFKADILKDLLPPVDLILCRDCLVHFSDKHVWRAIRVIQQSKIKYLLTTTFPRRAKNPAIVTGSWRPLNLQAHPFYFPDPIAIYFEGTEEMNGAYADKALALWEVAKISNPYGR